jgi:uncharacterized protein (TIGR03084 family)
MLAPLDGGGWSLPSACQSWTVADVVLHLAQTDELAAASARGRIAETAAGMRWTAVGERQDASLTVDDMAGAAVDRERGAPWPEVYARWKRGSRDLLVAFGGCAPNARLQWVVGDLAARTLVSTRLAECWIHTGDVAEGIGVDHPPTGRLWHIARLAHRTLPYAFARAGRQLSAPVVFRLSAPDDPEAEWTFGQDVPGVTTVWGPAVDLCRVAGQRASAAETALAAEGPDAASVVELVRTFA